MNSGDCSARKGRSGSLPAMTAGRADARHRAVTSREGMVGQALRPRCSWSSAAVRPLQGRGNHAADADRQDRREERSPGLRRSTLPARMEPATVRISWNTFASLRLIVCEGNTMPGVVAPASRALAVGNAEQAASRSKAAVQALCLPGRPERRVPSG